MTVPSPIADIALPCGVGLERAQSAAILLRREWRFVHDFRGTKVANGKPVCTATSQPAADSAEVDFYEAMISIRWSVCQF